MNGRPQDTQRVEGEQEARGVFNQAYQNSGTNSGTTKNENSKPRDRIVRIENSSHPSHKATFVIRNVSTTEEFLQALYVKKPELSTIGVHISAFRSCKNPITGEIPYENEILYLKLYSR